MVECNVCNWQGEKFSPMIAPTYRRENAACPQCGSLERHRSLLIFLQENRWLRKGIRCLDVAPMRHFKSLFERCGACYVSIDLTSPRALKKMDLTSLEFGDNEFDLIICYHVLEHIKEDRKAIGEMFRVIAEDGLCLIQVPFSSSRNETIEYEKPDPSIHDHVRDYGNDVIMRIEESGFRVLVKTMTEGVSKERMEKFGLPRYPDISFLCYKR